MKNNNLHNIKSSGFKTPDNYFESFNETLLPKLKDKLELNKATGFKVPDDYFKTVDDNILRYINSKKETKVITLFSWRKVAYASAIAASLIFMFNALFNMKEEVNFNSIETASVEDYIITQDINVYDIASLLEDDALDEVNYTESDFSEKNIETFLINNLNIQDLENLYKE